MNFPLCITETGLPRDPGLTARFALWLGEQGIAGGDIASRVAESILGFRRARSLAVAVLDGAECPQWIRGLAVDLASTAVVDPAVLAAELEGRDGYPADFGGSKHIRLRRQEWRS